MLDGHDLMYTRRCIACAVSVAAMASRVAVVIGGQWGDEGKGKVNTGFVKPIAKGLLVVHPRRSRKLTTEVINECNWFVFHRKHVI